MSDFDGYLPPLPTKAELDDILPDERAARSSTPRLTTTTADVFCAGEPKPIEYIVKPILTQGGTTCVFGTTKVGKTTTVTHMVSSIMRPDRYPFLDSRHGFDGVILWLDLEQPWRVSQRRFRDAGCTSPSLHIYRGQPPSHAQLLATIDDLNVRGLVVDSVTRWLQLENENDSSEYERKFGPVLEQLHRRDITSVIIDHAGKGEGRGPRGSSHKVALVDIAVEMRAEGALADGRRRLSFTSREEIQPDLIIRLAGGRFVLEGTPASLALSDNAERILAGIRAGEQRKDALAKHLNITTKTLETWIAPLIESGAVKPVRSAGSGAPIVYHEVPRSSQKSLGISYNGNGR